MHEGVTARTGTAWTNDLTSFPRPSVAVDVAVLTVVDGCLHTVLWRRSGHTETGAWALPGSFVRERERLDRAVERTLRDKCGIAGLAPTQLQVMDDPERDARGWVLSVAHLDVVRPEAIAARRADDDVRLAPVRLAPDGVGARRPARSVVELPGDQARLPFDHEQIVTLAVDALRRRHRDRPDPYGLLGATFTILELRRLHEAVAGHTLQKDTFRRTMLPGLAATDTVEQGTVGRPARLYRRAEPPTDPERR